MTLNFGLRVPTAGTPQETAEYAARVEGAGFDFLWMPDTPLLAGRWRDVYGHLMGAAMTAKTLRLGPGVTNPLTRHPVTTASAILTLDEASNGRADLVAGTGYSSAYIIGHKAATLATMRHATLLWRSIFQGQATQLGGLEITLPTPHPRLPLYLAATGPKMLEMAGEIAAQNAVSLESRKLRRELTVLPLFGLIYFTVCGGSFGAEPMVGWSGPGLAILLFLLTPLFFSIPNMLMVREMQSMMPVEGGYYHWLKKAFGPFVGFMGGWMNWVVSWVDVSIYPVLAAYYLGYFFPALREGATIGGVFVSSTVLSFIVAVVLIWAVSLLSARRATCRTP